MTIQLDMLDGRRKKRNAKRQTQLEGKEQEALFKWAKLAECQYPALRLMHHIPNGGNRPPWEAKAFQRRGVKPGVPDICLPVARNGFHALYIELKRIGAGNDTTPSQNAFIDGLRQAGYEVCVCEGWDQARQVIEGYLYDR